MIMDHTEEQAALKKYLGPKKSSKITGWVFTVLTVVTLLGGILTTFFLNRMNAVAFNPEKTETDTQAYLDIVGISDWIYQYGDDIYYCAIDERENFYTLRMDKSLHSKMSAQQKYFEEDDAPKPEPYRVYGVVKKLGSSARKNLAEWWEISQTDYTSYFGETLLDTTASKGTQYGAFWFVGCFLCFIFAIVFVSDTLTNKSRANRHIKYLEEQGMLTRAAQQLNDSENLIINKDSARLSQEFLFGHGNGVVLPYRDILWCYQRTTRRNFSVVSTSLVVNTRAKKNITAILIGGKDTNNELPQAMMLISQRNPATLMGYTTENSKAYKELCKNG